MEILGEDLGHRRPLFLAEDGKEENVDERTEADGAFSLFHARIFGTHRYTTLHPDPRPRVNQP